MVPSYAGQIPFEMQGWGVGEAVSLLWANPGAQALLVKRRGSLVSTNKWLIFILLLIREVNIYNAGDLDATQMPIRVCNSKKGTAFDFAA